MSDFNYREFLTENRLTPLSKLLKEDVKTISNIDGLVIKEKGRYWIDREDVSTGEQLVAPGDIIAFKGAKWRVTDTTSGRDNDIYRLVRVRSTVKEEEKPTKFKPRSRFEDDSVLNSAQLMDAFEAPGGWDEDNIIDIHVEEEEKPYSWYGGFTLEFDGVSYEVNCQGTLEGYDHIIDFTDLEIESSEIIDPTPYEVDTRGPVKPRQLLPKELD